MFTSLIFTAKGRCERVCKSDTDDWAFKCVWRKNMCGGCLECARAMVQGAYAQNITKKVMKVDSKQMSTSAAVMAVGVSSLIQVIALLTVLEQTQQ